MLDEINQLAFAYMSTKNKTTWLYKNKEPGIWDYILYKHINKHNTKYTRHGFEYWCKHMMKQYKVIERREQAYVKFWLTVANIIPVKFDSKMYN